MSEAEHQDTNGSAAANGGDVPEIELIIKEEFMSLSEDEGETSSDDDDTHSKHSKDEENLNTNSNQQNVQIEEAIEELEEKLQSKRKTRKQAKIQQKRTKKHKPKDTTTSTHNKDTTNTNLLAITTTDSENTHFCYNSSNSTSESYARAVAEACEGFDESEENEEPICSVRKRSTTFNKPRAIVDDTQIQNAIKAVLEDGLSITCAAKKYNLIKSTLWARLNRLPQRSQRCHSELPVLTAGICNELSTGATLLQTANRLKVSKATVHRHKNKLIEMGLLEPMSIRKRTVQERLIQAHRAVRVNGMSIQFAAKFFSLPKVSLWRYIKSQQKQATVAENVVDNGDDDADDEDDDEDNDVEDEGDNGNDNEDDEVITEVVEEEELSMQTEFSQVSSTNMLESIENTTNINLVKIECTNTMDIVNSLEFVVDSSRDNVENTPPKNEFADYTDLHDEMIYEDELLIRLLK